MLENLLLCFRQDDVQLKIVDFGFAARLNQADCYSLSGGSSKCCSSMLSVSKEKEEEDHKVQDKCGTPSYTVPEVLCGIPYKTQAAMGSVGVIMMRAEECLSHPWIHGSGGKHTK
eukprot:14692419-Ditylum_brightwellii.AAC.1